MATKSTYKQEFSGQNIFINGFPKGGRNQKVFTFFNILSQKKYELKKFSKDSPGLSSLGSDKLKTTNIQRQPSFEDNLHLKTTIN